MGIRAFFDEWKARRRGRQAMRGSLGHTARDIVGPTGWMTSAGWSRMAEHSNAYQKSFDKRLPPSLFVSERDRQRHSDVIPVSERCIEDYHEPSGRDFEITRALQAMLDGRHDEAASEE